MSKYSIVNVAAVGIRVRVRTVVIPFRALDPFVRTCNTQTKVTLPCEYETKLCAFPADKGPVHIMTSSEDKHNFCFNERTQLRL